MSHHCEDEHHDHNHGHAHEAPIPTNSNQSLYSYIDTSKIRCLNTVTPTLPQQYEPYKSFLKDQDSRFNCSYYIQSDADCQVVIYIPFVGNCKLFSITLRTNSDDPAEDLSSPKTIKLFKNFNGSIDFDTLNASKEDFKFEHPRNVGVRQASETLDISEENEDESTFVEHYLPRRLFQNSSSLTLFLQDNWSQDEDQLCRIYYVEIRGEFSSEKALNNGAPLVNVYESAPNPVDHQKLETETDEIGLGM